MEGDEAAFDEVDPDLEQAKAQPPEAADRIPEQDMLTPKCEQWFSHSITFQPIIPSKKQSWPSG